MMAHVREEEEAGGEQWEDTCGKLYWQPHKLAQMDHLQPFSPLTTYSLLYQSDTCPGYLLDIDVCIESINDIFCLTEQDR